MKKRTKFSLSHYNLTTMKMGFLCPVGITEVLPGDTIQQATSALIRVTPLVAPVMHPCHCRIDHWYVPIRLIWDDFENFITGGPDGLDASVYPTITGNFAQGSLADHLGVPVGVDNLEVSALPFRAYDLIWNEWYRNQDTTDPVVISTASGKDTTTSTTLLAKAWAKDYFTTAAPWPQKGPAVSVPVNLTAAGEPTITATTTITGSGIPQFTPSGYGTNALHCSPNGTNVTWSAENVNSALNWVNPALTANTTIDFKSGNPELGSVDINQLREAFALQRFEEHRALYGSRYTEYLRYLGIRASDARLQRPEYLGGSRSTIQFSEVLQTAEGVDPVGTMRGHGISAMRTRRYRRFIEEHGLIITTMSVMPISIYQQGLPRMWNRRVKEDFWQKELEHIGEQEVLNKELYAASDSPDDVFGYQDRYDEYRSHQSFVSGEFRKLLNYWHFAREFSNQPTISTDFIYGAPTNRPFAEQTQDQLYCMINHSIQARRLVSRRGQPI
uniref:Major capsid protein n=1 Tax=Dulem virus 79 TaxID=3145790 RepID=A0AAU8B6T3_9VIRU